jgi:hypothetical protein
MLTVYRRHLRTCKSGHKEELRTSEFDERKKGWKRCDCPIFASGTLAGKSQRRNTGEWDWEPARLVAAKWEKLGTWNGKKPDPPQPRAEASTKPERISIRCRSTIEEMLAKPVDLPAVLKFNRDVRTESPTPRPEGLNVSGFGTMRLDGGQ